MNFERKTSAIIWHQDNDRRDKARKAWLDQRQRREDEFRPLYPADSNYADLFDRVAWTFNYLLRTFGLAERGRRNALNVRLRTMDLSFDALPVAFNGYRIAHITDPHFGPTDETKDAILAAVDGCKSDLCVLTGDYQDGYSSPPGPIRDSLVEIIAAIRPRDGAVATLGNHDNSFMVDPFEEAGIRVLGNDWVRLGLGADEILLTGIDDVYYFDSDGVDRALGETPDGFKVVLSHTPDAADAKFDLFLCGHTHGGQICLPGGIPLLTRSHGPRQFAKGGKWRCQEMIGVTNVGAGASFPKVRFNSRPEVLLLTLRKTTL